MLGIVSLTNGNEFVISDKVANFLTGLQIAPFAQHQLELWSSSICFLYLFFLYVL